MYDDLIYTVFKRLWVRLLIAGLLFAFAGYLYQDALETGVLLYGMIGLAGIAGLFILALPMTFIWPEQEIDDDRADRIAQMAEEKRQARAKENKN